MTTRHAGYIVTLDRDIREDDAAPILAAIKLLKGVVSVKPIIASLEQHLAEERVKLDLGQKLLAVVYPEKKR